MIEQSKEADYLALRQTQGTIRTETPDWQAWLTFFLRALAEQVRRLNRKVEREKLVLAALPELSFQIVEFAREHGRITMADAVRLTAAIATGSSSISGHWLSGGSLANVAADEARGMNSANAVARAHASRPPNNLVPDHERVQAFVHQLLRPLPFGLRNRSTGSTRDGDRC